MNPTLGLLTTLGNYLLLKAQSRYYSPFLVRYDRSMLFQSGHGIITDSRLKQLGVQVCSPSLKHFKWFYQTYL
jgi:hypothetical protein